MVGRVSETVSGKMAAAHVRARVPAARLLVDDLTAKIDFCRHVAQAVRVKQGSRVVSDPGIPILQPPMSFGAVLLPAQLELPGRAGMGMLANVRESASNINGIAHLDEGRASQIVATAAAVIVRREVDEQAGPVVAVKVAVFLPPGFDRLARPAATVNHPDL